MTTAYYEAAAHDFNVEEYAPVIAGWNESPALYLERYFETRFFVDEQSQAVFFVRQANNGLCVIGLERLPPSFSMDISDASSNVDVRLVLAGSLKNGLKASGKKKKDAAGFRPQDALCTIQIHQQGIINGREEEKEEGSGDGGGVNDKTVIELKVPACINGQLIEFNERLVKNPRLLMDDSYGTGFVAILRPKAKDPSKATSNLLSKYQLDEQV
ncbi:hypothetical protein GQ42DRAFT_170308 [Ramicandelaber brevisporus]|nr:hypothetical protein GQ42DRAFT_170308 [Ramicandelaber brevisporus]